VHVVVPGVVVPGAVLPAAIVNGTAFVSSPLVLVLPELRTATPT
jgi:hypothetical protein